MNYNDFNITDNGDGTFTLTPKTGAIDLDALRQEYLNIKGRAETLLTKRARINEELQVLAARRDELKAIYVNGGYGDPDPVPDPDA